jgi:hypothetical protein
MIDPAMSGDLNVKTENENQRTEEERLFRGVLWLNAKALGLVLGLLCGLAVFVATNWLVIKGGNPVGPHLRLLGQYFIGYRVSFLGSLIGFAYGFAVGTLSGALMGWIYNAILGFRR